MVFVVHWTVLPLHLPLKFESNDVVDEDGRLIAGIKNDPHHYPESAGFVYGLRHRVHKATIDRTVGSLECRLFADKTGKTGMQDRNSPNGRAWD
jgi:hypothetical protein